MAAKFNEARPYSTVSGDPAVRYMQDGNMFDSYGEFVRQSPPEHRLPPKPELRLGIATTPEAVLARASAKLGIKQSDPTVPSELVEAARENAQARAAEDWEGDE
jgi:hypothetical protein